MRGQVQHALHLLNVATLLLRGVCCITGLLTCSRYGMYGMHWADCAKPMEQNFCMRSQSEVSGTLCVYQFLCTRVQLLGRHCSY